MFKTIKKVFLSALSVLGVSFLVWIVILMNPNLAYSSQTQFDNVTIYHNQPLEQGTETVIKNAISILKTSPLYKEDLSIELCMNDGSFYTGLNPLYGKPLAFAMLDKTVLSECTPNFNENTATTQWPVNNYEFRTFDLTWLLAHEFTHNLQNKTNLKYIISNNILKINWKLEGHAEYVSRQYKNDGKLKEKIQFLLLEQEKEHTGLPVIEYEDGTMQIFSYYKYALVTQYLMEQENLTHFQICKDERTLDEHFNNMMAWSKK